MCSICGFYGKGDESLIHLMNEQLTHRGPDSTGTWVDTDVPIGLGMNRLAIIDLISGNQPLFNEDRSVVGVYNGEIYNYKYLRQELIQKGHTFTSSSDSEVLVHGYEEYGQDLPKYLQGMFSFAIYDRHKRTLFCARDRLGIKPFYYFHSGQEFYFASEQKPILRILDTTPKISRRSLMRHLIIGFYTGPFSLFKGLHQLSPGHCLTFTDGKLFTMPYWKLSDASNDSPLSVNEATDKLKDSLSLIVKDHMISDVPVGLTLSGGLDSSILAHLMVRGTNGSVSNSKLHAFTVGYGHQSDEIPFANMISRDLPINPHVRICDPESAIQNLPRIVWHLEEPLSNITAVTAYEWARFVSESLKVTLVGEGADEIFGGYFQYRLFSGLARITPSYITKRLFRFATLQPSLQLIIKLLGASNDVTLEAKEVFYDEFLSPLSNGTNGLRGALRFDIEHELSNNQLLRVDRMTMAHGLEARVPYLDHRLVEMLWAMPDALKIKGSNQKYLLRKTYEDMLPEVIINRPKIGAGGSQPLFPILFKSGLEAIIVKILSDKNIPALEWFDSRIISELIHGQKGVYPILSTRIRDKLLYAILMFVIWHRLFIEKRYTKRTDIPELNELFSI